jgi:hypothetical protein
MLFVSFYYNATPDNSDFTPTYYTGFDRTIVDRRKPSTLEDIEDIESDCRKYLKEEKSLRSTVSLISWNTINY